MNFDLGFCRLHRYKCEEVHNGSRKERASGKRTFGDKAGFIAVAKANRDAGNKQGK
ncbi:hypothetical protein [Parapedobacter koreensis]|uniref:hypothetical protein n=1 Tax=Parapedobacter koreensis TaxID=332977 RepID=UPI0015A6EA7F|nr:hypothetical protein [Parapedobacter koreensis]